VSLLFQSVDGIEDADTRRPKKTPHSRQDCYSQGEGMARCCKSGVAGEEGGEKWKRR